MRALASVSLLRPFPSNHFNLSTEIGYHYIYICMMLQHNRQNNINIKKKYLKKNPGYLILIYRVVHLILHQETGCLLWAYFDTSEGLKGIYVTP